MKYYSSNEKRNCSLKGLDSVIKMGAKQFCRLKCIPKMFNVSCWGVGGPRGDGSDLPTDF